MISFENPILGILFGAVLTAIIQSSSASVGILQGLSLTGVVSFGSAIPIILGQNIGTCVTAMLGAGVISAAPLFEAALGQPVQNDTQETYALAVTMMVIPGAFLASIPARLRRKGRTKSTWKTCLTAFLGAILAAEGADLAGGSVLSGALQGNISGLAALVVAVVLAFRGKGLVTVALASCATVYLAERILEVFV
jgi:Na+/phosphate symporter